MDKKWYENKMKTLSSNSEFYKEYIELLKGEVSARDKEIKKLKQTTIQLHENGCCPYFEDGGLCGLIHGGIG